MGGAGLSVEIGEALTVSCARIRVRGLLEFDPVDELDSCRGGGDRLGAGILPLGNGWSGKEGDLNSGKLLAPIRFAVS